MDDSPRVWMDVHLPKDDSNPSLDQCFMQPRDAASPVHVTVAHSVVCLQTLIISKLSKPKPWLFPDTPHRIGVFHSFLISAFRFLLHGVGVRIRHD